MSRTQLEALFVKIFPVGDSKAFCDHIFRIFDDDKSNTIEFKEFIMAIAVTQLHSERDKLAWAFRLYDIDASGTINVTEMQNIIETLDQIEGRTPNAVDTTGETKNKILIRNNLYLIIVSKVQIFISKNLFIKF